MIFLDPKSDIAFKKLFGDITHKSILISFLNSVLGRVGGKTIVDVVMNDPNNVAETPLSKASIVDVRCTDQDNNQYIVEMQIVSQKDYAARAQYYSGLALSRQLASGDQYGKLVPVIFVGILDFPLFKTVNYISHHFILDKETLQHELRHLEFHFIELPKFTKELDNLDAFLDKWIYILKHASTLKMVPATLTDSILKEAFEVLEQGSWSKTELEAYDRYLDAIRSSKSQLETAEERGEARGIMKANLEAAKKLLGILDVQTIAKTLGLTIEQVEELKKKI